MNIKELGLSTRAYHILKRNFIDTVEQLEGKSREDLMNIPGVGFGTATEIMARVRAVKMTNADNIRSMTDEELAAMLTTGRGGFDCFECRNNMHNCELDCTAACMDWLKQPYKEE